MNTLARYTAADLSSLMDKIAKNSIGLDDYFDRVLNHSVTNYPPCSTQEIGRE